MATQKKVQTEDNVDVEVKFKGVVITVPTGDNIPTAAALAFDEGKGLKFLELLIGPDQWRQVLNVAPTVGDLKEFGDTLYAAMDTTSGE